MADKINTVAPIARIVDMQTSWNTTIKEYPNGRTTTQQNWSTPKHFWDIEFDGITLLEYEALRAHFNEVKGQFGTFLFEDTHTEEEYTVRYGDDKLGRKPVSPNVRGLYNVRVKLEENK